MTYILLLEHQDTYKALAAEDASCPKTNLRKIEETPGK